MFVEIGCGSICVLVILVILVTFCSFCSLEPSQYGLRYDWWWSTVSDNNGKAYTAGRYRLGVTSRFIKFPAMVETLQFTDELFPDRGIKPAIWSRTSDGLAVKLECSLQYQLVPENVTKLYEQLGTWDETQVFFAKLARSCLMTEATHHSAQKFFQNRTIIQPIMEQELYKLFRDQLFSYTTFQLQKIILPPEFEQAIQTTTHTQQEAPLALAQRDNLIVDWTTKLQNMQNLVDARVQNARAQAADIMLQGEARGQRLLLQAKADAAATFVKARAVANATIMQRKSDATSMLAACRAETATVRLQSQTYFNATNISYHLQALSYKGMKDAVGNEDHFLEFMKVQALQNVSWKGMAVNAPHNSDPLSFMGLASAS